jgi:hypothetical protein
MGSGELGDELALPGGLHRVRVIVPPDVLDGLVGRHPVEDGDAGKPGAGTAPAARAPDLHALPVGPLPRLDQHLPQRDRVGWQPVVGPSLTSTIASLTMPDFLLRNGLSDAELAALRGRLTT